MSHLDPPIDQAIQDCSGSELSPGDQDPAVLHVVQLTDLHLFMDPQQCLLGVNTEQTFQGVLQAASTLTPKPDVMLLTGDLSQDGSPQSYHRLRAYADAAPIDEVYWLPGNHDELGAMSTKLNGSRILTDKVFTKANWCFILLNTLRAGRVAGYLSKEELATLHHTLTQVAQQGQYVVLGLHHPPFQVGTPWLDSSRLTDPDQFLSILDLFENVRVVLFGHIHQDFHHVRQGVTYLGCPSTCVQFLPQSVTFSAEPIPPAFRQLWLYKDGSFSTCVTRVLTAYQEPDLSKSGY